MSLSAPRRSARHRLAASARPSASSSARARALALVAQIAALAQLRFGPFDEGPADDYNRLCAQLAADLPVPADLAGKVWPGTRTEETWTATALAAVALGTDSAAPGAERSFALRVQSCFLTGRRARRYYARRHLTVLYLRARKGRTRADFVLAYLDADGRLVPTPEGIPNLIVGEVKITPTAAFNASEAQADYAVVLAKDPALARALYGPPRAGQHGDCDGRVPHPPSLDCATVGTWHTPTRTDASGRKVYVTTAMQLQAYCVEVSARLADGGYPALAADPNRRDGFVLLDGYARTVDERLCEVLPARWGTASALRVCVVSARTLLQLQHPDAQQRPAMRPSTIHLVGLLYARSLYL